MLVRSSQHTDGSFAKASTTRQKAHCQIDTSFNCRLTICTRSCLVAGAQWSPHGRERLLILAQSWASTLEFLTDSGQVRGRNSDTGSVAGGVARVYSDTESNHTVSKRWWRFSRGC